MIRTVLDMALRLYPRPWREHHGDELQALIDDLLADPREQAWRVVMSTAFGAVHERLRPKYWHRARFLVLGALGAVAAVLVLGVFALVSSEPMTPGSASPSVGPIPNGVRYPSGVDFPKVPGYVPDLDRQGKVVGYSPKQDLFPPLPPSVVVPNVVGLAPATASAHLKSAGLYMVTESERSATVPSGRIMDVVPSAGQSVQVAQDVVVVVSVGPDGMPSAPSTAYRAPTAADMAAQNAKLVVPVYAADLRTLVGHMYPNKGFVPIGTSPAGVPDFPTSHP